MLIVLIIETNLIFGYPNTRCVDSVTTSHICNMLQKFQETQRLNEWKVLLKVGNGATV